MTTASQQPEATRSQRAVAWLATVGRAFLAFLPAWMAYLLADLAVPVLVAVTLWRERRISRLGRGMFRNLRIAFRDELTPRRSRKLLWAWARHMTHLFPDHCRIPNITRSNLERHVDVSEIETIRALHAEGEGVICVGGHFGVWELSGHVVALSGLPANGVSRPTGNPALNEAINRIRCSGGMKVIGKWGVLWPLRKALCRGEMVGLAADENRKKDPVFVPFMGTMAATNSTAALLQRRTGAPIAVVTCNRVGRGRYRFHVWDVIRNPRSSDRDVELLSVTRRISEGISRALRAYPEQWLWGSRRFQTRPAGEEFGPDGLPPLANAVAHPSLTAA